MASLHTRKGLAKITAHPHCTNLAGGGGFTGGKSNMRCHLRKRFGKRQSCTFCLTKCDGIAGGINFKYWCQKATAVKGNCRHGTPCGGKDFHLPHIDGFAPQV